MKEKLRLAHVAKSFTENKQTVNVLADISLTVREGEFVTLIGPSGSGKSTIFKLIGGLLVPDAGTIELDGESIVGRKGLISYMPQGNSLFPWRTVEQNVALALEISGRARKQAILEARKWLGKAGLAGYEHVYPHVLSGGMQQRAAFLRALLAPRELMCLDEPFGSLDAFTRIGMQQWLLRVWEESRRTVLFITHSIEEAIFLSDRIYVLSAKPTRILREFAVPFARPREEAVMLGAEFADLRKEIYELMRKACPFETGTGEG
ncbi:MAG TPA: ABC transporter ATP-binding protein [Bacilli bacterium]